MPPIIKCIIKYFIIIYIILPLLSSQLMTEYSILSCELKSKYWAKAHNYL